MLSIQWLLVFALRVSSSGVTHSSSYDGSSRINCWETFEQFLQGTWTDRLKRHSHHARSLRVLRAYENAARGRTRSRSEAYPRSMRIIGGYASLNTDARMSAVRSARRIRPNRVEFDLSGRRTRRPHAVRAVCECLCTNLRDRLERIRSGSARTMRCWADTRSANAAWDRRTDGQGSYCGLL